MSRSIRVLLLVFVPTLGLATGAMGCSKESKTTDPNVSADTKTTSTESAPAKVASAKPHHKKHRSTP